MDWAEKRVEPLRCTIETGLSLPPSLSSSVVKFLLFDVAAPALGRLGLTHLVMCGTKFCDWFAWLRPNCDIRPVSPAAAFVLCRCWDMALFMKKATLTSYRPPRSTTIMLPSAACSCDYGFHQRSVAGDVLADSVSQAKKSPGLTRSARVQSHLPKQLSRSETSLKLMQSSLCSLNSFSSLATF